MRVAAALAMLASSAFGAANMAISTLTIDTQGRLVATLSPCSSPLSPGTGVTGITITGANAWANAAQSSSTSGCVVTIKTQADGTSTFPITADDTAGSITLTLAAASNLTDAGSNTIATGGTSAHPSANNSAWLPLKGTAISGKVRLDGNPNTYPHPSTIVNTAIWMSSNGCVRFNATATQIQINAFDGTSANAWALIQDGVGTYGSIQNSGQVNNTNNWTAYTWTGMSGAHLYEICDVNDTRYPDIAMLNVTGTYGSLPAARQNVLFFGASEMDPSWFTPGTGTYSAYDTRNHVSWQVCRPLGCNPQYLGQAGWPVTDDTGCTLGNCQQINATNLTINKTYVILSVGTTNWTLIGAGANTVGTTFTTNGTNTGTGSGIAGLTYPTSNLRDCAIGTSICKSQTGGPYTFGSDGWNAVVVDEGGNDPLTTTAIGAAGTAGTFTGDAVTMMQNLVTRFAPTKLLVIDQYCAPGVPPTNTCPNNNQVSYKTAWHNASSSYNGGSPSVSATILYDFNAGWVDFTNDFQSAPAYHLNPAGQTHWANTIIPALGPMLLGGTTYTVAPGAPATFTLTLNNTGQFGGNGQGCTTAVAGSSCQAVTLSDGGKGGTFAISGGTSGNASPYTFTPAQGATSFTFTYTGTSTTPVTITTTASGSGAGWFNPATNNAYQPGSTAVSVP